MDEFTIKYYEKQFTVRIAKYFIRKLFHRGSPMVHLRIIMKTILDELREYELREGNESTLVSVVIEHAVEASETKYLSPYYLKLGSEDSIALGISTEIKNGEATL